MIKDPTKKGNGPTKFRDPIMHHGKSKGRINTSQDYSMGVTSLQGRLLFLGLCILPYIGICLVVYLQGLKALGLIMLAIPFVLLSFFRYLDKKL